MDLVANIPEEAINHPAFRDIMVKLGEELLVNHMALEIIKDGIKSAMLIKTLEEPNEQ